LRVTKMSVRHPQIPMPPLCVDEFDMRSFYHDHHATAVWYSAKVAGSMPAGT
jgi:hypothetical protein